MQRGDVTRRAPDALARVAGALKPTGEERPHRACRVGLAPGAVVGSHSPTTCRQATGRQVSRASWRPPRNWPAGEEHLPSGPTTGAAVGSHSQTTGR